MAQAANSAGQTLTSPTDNPLEQPDPLAASLNPAQPKARPLPLAATPSTTTPAQGAQPALPIAPQATAPDTQTPASGLGTALASPGTPATPAAQPTTSTTANGTVALAPTDPNNPLTSQTISVGPTADRFGIAQNQLQSVIDNILNPQFAADQRTLNQDAAAKGQLGSGMLRTNLGNLDLARQQNLNATASSFLNNALTGTINDAYQNVGIAQQQQGFQNQQQQEAFNNSLQQLLAGSQGDPTSIELALAQLYGGQSSAAGEAAASAAGANTANNASSGQLNQILSILQGTTPNLPTSTPTGTGSSGTDPFTLPPNLGLPTVGSSSGGYGGFGVPPSTALPYASGYSSYLGY